MHVRVNFHYEERRPGFDWGNRTGSIRVSVNDHGQILTKTTPAPNGGMIRPGDARLIGQAFTRAADIADAKVKELTEEGTQS